jgi:chemotaxis protein MotB
LNDVPNHITITGHTDSLAYSGNQEGYSNWELSSDRANAARRELLAGGMKDNKILQVRGLADALPLFKNQPLNPGNRRISIVVLNKATEANFLQDGGTSKENQIEVGPSQPRALPAPAGEASAHP